MCRELVGHWLILFVRSFNKRGAARLPLLFLLK
jgi:hypothetical protein